MTPLLQGIEQTALPGRLNPFYLEGRPLPLATPLAQQLGLRDGQVVQATIEARGDTLKLLLSGRLLDLPPGLRLRPGDTVWLRAIAGAGGWTLKPVDPGTAHPAAASTPPLAGEPALPPGMSRLLALSLRPPMSPTLMQLFQPQVASGLLQSAASPELAALFQRLQLSMRGLTPSALQATVISSGFWLEALLARGQGAGGDVKSLLRRLVRAIAEREPAMAESLRRAVDDIEAAQVESLAAQARGEFAFSMVLPFTDANPVHLRFFRPRRRPGEEAPPFSVDIHTINDVLGEIWLKTSVTRAAHVELMMWARKDSVVRLARRYADALGERLLLAGLTLDSFRIFHAARPSLPDSWTPPGAVLDVRA